MDLQCLGMGFHLRAPTNLVPRWRWRQLGPNVFKMRYSAAFLPSNLLTRLFPKTQITNNFHVICFSNCCLTLTVINLDSDILVLSNLTEMWVTFTKKMGDQKLAPIALNNEPTAVGFYSKGEGGAKIPYYGDSSHKNWYAATVKQLRLLIFFVGLNAGVLLMNLTQMRAFKFTERSIAAHTLYNGKIKLADQDLIKIIFHGFPGKFITV